MAPIIARPIGVTPQIIDDDRLTHLRKSLEEINLTPEDSSIVDVEKVVTLLDPWKDWPFEELVDLQEWVDPLNRIDTCLSFYVRKYPSLLLVTRVERSKSKGEIENLDTSKQNEKQEPATSLDDVNSVPEKARENIVLLLKFLSAILANSSSKHIFNSVDELADFLGAADDNIAKAALQALCSLSAPPPLHRQQVPEFQQHMTTLHSSSSVETHRRLMALSKGWGARGSGLGLYDCVIADDSEFGQGSLQPQAGELHFSFMNKRPSGHGETSAGSVDTVGSSMCQLHLTQSDIMDDSAMSIETSQSINDDTNPEGKQKRRRVLPPAQREKVIRSSADLFFRCVERAGGREYIPDDCLFRLLADVRLARSFHCQSSRISAVNLRLLALITAINSHPSHEFLTGYFQAQPEICIELVDLLRPTVSSNAVSTTNINQQSEGENGSMARDALSTLASSPIVPYETRELALEALTSLVSRRDNTNGALTGVARQSNVLNELGVGKGQYLGLLPTLLRYSLASLGSLFSVDGASEVLSSSPEVKTDEVVAFDIGLAFIEATAPSPLPRYVQIEMALHFIDSVLSLTAAVVSTQSGTAALTECGLVPALLNTISIDVDDVVSRMQSGTVFSEYETQNVKAMLRFVAAQAVQILEGSIVTHATAFSALQNLKGVEILTERLSREIVRRPAVSEKSVAEGDVAPMEIDNSLPLDENKTSLGPDSQLRASRRVLIFGLVTCLTVIFHQESTSSTAAMSTGATEVQKPSITQSLIEIMDESDIYGGSLCSLVATLLSDVMNSDPHVVRYIHESGLAKSFLGMIALHPDGNPRAPPAGEFLMVVPSVIAALSLTEDGAKLVKEANPFPALLNILHHPSYAMPKSRCLLNDLNSAIGSGCEEIMRHVPSLKSPICGAICDGMKCVASFGASLLEAEENSIGKLQQAGPEAEKLQNDRTCLMQYALNFGQLLEQILHNDDQCDSFVKVGGIDAILDLYPYLMPGEGFLAQISCMSSPSTSTLNHSTTEDVLTGAFRCIALRHSPTDLLNKIVQRLSDQLLIVRQNDRALRETFSAPVKISLRPEEFNATLVLDGVPRCLLVENTTDPRFLKLQRALTAYLRELNTLHWLTSLLAAVIKGASSREGEGGPTWRRTEKEWRKELASEKFQQLLGRLSSFHNSATLEACRIRSEDGAEELENLRQLGDRSKCLRYKLKVVCPEGAVVRDGIDIDACASLGSLEMGEIVEAYDRCINASGVMRYRTQRGWLSEQTRGQGREPIAEVLAIWQAGENIVDETSEDTAETRVEAGIADLRTSSASILARLQTSYSELYTSLIRYSQQTLKSVASKTVIFNDPNSDSAQVGRIMRGIVSGIEGGFMRSEVVVAGGFTSPSEQNDESRPGEDKRAVSLYLGSLLHHLQGCIFEDRRERVHINMPILVAIGERALSGNDCTSTGTEINFFDAISFILSISLEDFKVHSEKRRSARDADSPHRQSLSRTVASCYPQAISFLQRLLVGPSIGQTSFSPMSEVLDKMKAYDVDFLVGRKKFADYSMETVSGNTDNFSTSDLLNDLSLKVSDVLKTFWNDARFSVYAPPHVVSPVTRLVTAIITTAQTSKSDAVTQSTASRQRTRRNDEENLLAAALGLGGIRPDEDFEPSADTIARMMEMGFSEDHAWDAVDSTRSNSLEIAMEYALSHPAPSAEEVARRRQRSAEQRSERQRLAGESSAGSAETNHQAESEPNDDDAVPMETETSSGKSSGEPEKHTSGSKDKKEERKTKIENMIESWKCDGPKVALDFLTCARPGSKLDMKDGDGDLEAVAIVSASFLIDMCNIWSDKQEHILLSVIRALKEQIATAMVVSSDDTEDSSSCQIQSGQESNVAMLCHCIILLGRALPKTLKIILKEGGALRVVEIVREFSKSPFERWPVWLSPVVLLLELMARPVVAFPSEDSAESDDDTKENAEEYVRVKEAHGDYASSLSILAQKIVSSLNPSSAPSNDQGETKPNGEAEDLGVAPSMKGQNDTSDQASTIDSMFKSVPPFFPLLTFDSIEASAESVLRLLSRKPPPGVCHALLLLLLATCRFPRISKKCFESQGIETILHLPRDSRFKNHTALCSLVFRRLVEDETTLQAAMENEIRVIILKINGKKSTSTQKKKEAIRVPRKDFVSSVKPLLLRDPFSFLRAMAVTAAFEPGSSSSNGYVALLPADQKASNTIALSKLLKRDGSCMPERPTSPAKKASGRWKRLSISSTGKSKSHKRSHTPKRSKKDKVENKERQENLQNSSVISATNHVVSLLVEHAIATSATSIQTPVSSDSEREEEVDRSFGFTTQFFWTGDALQVLGDLILCLPSCSTAMFKHSRSTKHKNALAGRSFVSFCIQSFLPLRRYGNAVATGNPKDNIEGFYRTKIAQLASRILLLTGKRTISELVFALSGGLLSGNNIELDVDRHYCAPEICAAQSWGELALAFMVPRSNAGSSMDSDNTISADIAKTMLDNGMPHALLIAVHLAPVDHPYAPRVIGTLLCALERLTRPTVRASVRALGASTAKVLPASNESPEHLSDETQNQETLRDESMILDDHGPGDDIVIGPEAADDGMDTGDEDNDAEEDEDEESMETDSSASSSEDSEDDSEGNDDDDDDEDDDDDDENDIDSDEEDEFDEGSNAADEQFDYNALNEGSTQDLVEDDEDQPPPFNGSNNGDGEWTLLGGPAGASGRQRNVMDAAHAMINQIMRSGEVGHAQLQELQEQLGLRIIQNGAQQVTATMRSSSPGGLIWQQQQPASGYSSLGARGTNELNSMEFLFSVLSSGNPNYSLVRPSSREDEESNAASGVFDEAPLFPGGPMASRTRPINPQHPLHEAVHFPPPNALAYHAEPNGARARASSHPLPSRRPAGHGNYFSRSTPSTRRSPAVQSGWIDYDYDRNVDNFTSGFETAFASAISTRTIQPDQTSTATNNATEQSRAPEESSPDQETSPDSLEQVNEAVESVQGHSGDGNSVGEAVASSLATGLRLTSSAPQDRATSGEEDAERQPEEGEEDGEGLPEEGEEDGEGLPGEEETEETPVEGNEGPTDDNVQEMDVEAEGGNGDGTEEDTQEQATETNNNESSNTNESASTPANSSTNSGAPGDDNEANPSNEREDNVIACPPGADIDPSVWAALPREMQEELAAQAAGSEPSECPEGYDQDVWAALPQEMREEVLRETRRESQSQEEAADPRNATEMDNASFVASLTPALREEILLTADDEFIQSLPPNIVAEAQVLRERARTNQRLAAEEADAALQRSRPDPATAGAAAVSQMRTNDADAARRRQRSGKVKVDCDKDITPLAKCDVITLVRLYYLLSPVVPSPVLSKLFLNFSEDRNMRLIITRCFVNLLVPDKEGVQKSVDSLTSMYKGDDDLRAKMDVLFKTTQFPPSALIGVAEVSGIDRNNTSNQIRRRLPRDSTAQQAAQQIALCLPTSSRGSTSDDSLPPVVSVRILDSLQALSGSLKFCLTMLMDDVTPLSSTSTTGFESLLDLLHRPQYTKSASDLEQLLRLLELVVAPLHHLPKHQGDDENEISKVEIETAASEGKEWVDVPRVKVSAERLRYLCSVLKLGTCKDASFSRVNTIARRLCRIDANRGYVLAELGSVAMTLGRDAVRDLKALAIQLSAAIHKRTDSENARSASTSVPVSASETEVRLLRVLQTLAALCSSDDAAAVSSKKIGSICVSHEFVELLNAMDLDELWDELSSCLKLVQILEGVSMEKDADTKAAENSDGDDMEDGQIDGRKKLQNSVAGILTRFLPLIESFFIATASTVDKVEEQEEFGSLVGGPKLQEFVEANKVLINALVRNNPGLIDKGQMRVLVQIPSCRRHLDFDVKRHWFKTQVRRLRQQANRRYGSLRLVVRRSNVFADSYHQLRLRNSDEMRGRLVVSFRQEAGVDAGGLSRNWFSILAQEMFNPNYALFTSTEDGCTFQPNPLSSINPDHLSYFRFVGRVVGKAVSDGYLMDAHMTRSLYKHMIGVTPSVEDMEAIDPDYYKNLKAILEYNLEDLGLELSFSMEDHSFGRKRIIDLIENGRNVPVTEENKADYVSKICHYRMTTSISSQIKAFLDGFHELVRKDLIQIFTPKELELLISGLPDIDIDDLKKNTEYVGWKATDQQIEWFWNVLFSLSRSQKAAFVQFVTGSSKVPLAGFAELPGMRGVQKFSIHKVGGSSGSLMSAHTCFNSLDLPKYESEEQLREKLLYAITEGSGAFLLA